ncbi:MAG TPA: Uma2 family endonuclease [Tepidisphaeraceae bacterium]|nr:Uma2 family endonuclease [Tepidisphaeraceae bacterium]
MTIDTKPITADELFAMGDIGRCELIYGKLVMMSPAGSQHGFVAARIGRILGQFVEDHGLGYTFAAETGFKIETGPDLVRAPDASFVRAERLPDGLPPRGYLDGVPDLAVEVVSPEDKKREVAEKVNMWLAHGTISCWVADPKARTVTVHRTGQREIRLAGDDVLRDEPTLPSFAIAVSQFFKLPGRAS